MNRPLGARVANTWVRYDRSIRLLGQQADLAGALWENAYYFPCCNCVRLERSWSVKKVDVRVRVAQRDCTPVRSWRDSIINYFTFPGTRTVCGF